MEEKKRVPGFVRLPGFILLGIGVFAGFGAIVMLLWNALMPDIFGLGVIGYWQALGLAVFARLLIGGFGGGSKKPKHPKMRRSKRWHAHCHYDDDKQFDEAYDQWWEKEGAQQFEDYIKKSKESTD